MKQQQGFIFIVTLYITAIMSLLLLSSMQHVLLYQRAVNKQEEERQRFYQLEHIARHLIHVPIDKLHQCIIKSNSANQVIQQVIKKQGCSFVVGMATYQYLIEDLGEYSCLVSLHQEVLKSTHHFRLTLLAPSDTEYPSSLIQIRVIKPATSLSCVHKTKYVALGISSWRYLENWQSGKISNLKASSL